MMNASPNAPLILDLCGTLIAENTTNAFVDEWLKLSPWRRRLRSIFGGRRIVSVLALRGLRREFLEEEAASYVRDRLANHSNPAVMQALRDARDRGHPIFLATASLDCIAMAVQSQLRLQGAVTAKLGYNRRGRCTGFFAVDTTGRKLAHLRRLLSDDMLRQATLYTDNREDLDLLRIAAHPHFLGQRRDLAGLSDPETARVQFLPVILAKVPYAAR